MNERTPLIVGGSLIVLLVIVAVFVGFNPTVETYDASTPEGTVQSYLQALLDGDEATASALLVDDPEDPCLEDSFDRPVADSRISIDEVEVGDGAATVSIVTTQIGDAVIGNSRYDSAFRLVAVDGGWRIEAADWPYGCGDIRPVTSEE